MPGHRTVEIIGGGLSGLALGLGLRSRGIPVTLHEAGTYPRHRVCGEFLTGLDPATTDIPGLDTILSTALPARSVAWHEPGSPPVRHTLPEPALCISRHRLDHALASAFVEAGGDLRTASRPDSSPRDGRVLACGRRPDPASPWIGLKQHFLGLPLAEDLELHLGRNAYVGLTRVEDGAVNVCGLFPRTGRRQSLPDAIAGAGLTSLAERLMEAEPVEGSLCAVSGLAYEPAGHHAGTVSLGDRHGLIPPFTGHGMTLALLGAAAAVGHLAAWSAGAASWDETCRSVDRELARNFGRRLRWGRRLHPWLLDPPRRRILHGLGRLRLLPFKAIYRLLH